MSSVPVLMSNGWLAGTVTPDACSSGVSPDFYNESTGQVFVCAANAYVPITGSGSPGQPQSPWLSDIDGGGFGLFNAKSLGIGLGFAPTGVGNVFIGGADSSSPAIVSLLNNSFNGLNMFMNGTTGAPAGPTFFGNAQITSDTNLFLGASGHPGQVAIMNTGFVGINNTSPAFALDVTGDINLTGQILIGGTPVALVQTPWLSAIDAAGFALNNIPTITNFSGDIILNAELNSLIRLRFGTEFAVNVSRNSLGIAASQGGLPGQLNLTNSTGQQWTIQMESALTGNRLMIGFQPSFPTQAITISTAGVVDFSQMPTVNGVPIA